MTTKFDCVFPFATEARALNFSFRLNFNNIRTRRLGYAAIVMPVSLTDEQMAFIEATAKELGCIRK